MTNRLIPITILLGFLAYIHVPIFFKIDITSVTQQSICYPLGPPGTYRMVLSLFTLIYFGLSASLCMLLFGLLTVRNIERSKRIVAGLSSRVETINSQNTQRTNRQLHRMLFLQVLVYCGTGTAFSMEMIVTSINPSETKHALELAQDNLIIAVVGVLSNTGPCLSFYLFTLSSGMFRRELKKLFCKFNGNGDHSPWV